MATIQEVIFKIGEEEYGFNISKVYVIEDYKKVINIPNTPDYVEGIVNLRGVIIPIYNLRTKFHMPLKEKDSNTKIIIVYSNDLKIGFVVDSVTEIIHLDENDIDEFPVEASKINENYIESVAKIKERIIILLDVESIINQKEKEELGQVVAQNNA